MDDEIIVGLPGRTIYQAKAELYFTFGALAVESHFMPAFSQADWLLGVGEANCENDSKDRHKTFHGASPSVLLRAAAQHWRKAVSNIKQ